MASRMASDPITATHAFMHVITFAQARLKSRFRRAASNNLTYPRSRSSDRIRAVWPLLISAQRGLVRTPPIRRPGAIVGDSALVDSLCGAQPRKYTCPLSFARLHRQRGGEREGARGIAERRTAGRRRTADGRAVDAYSSSRRRREIMAAAWRLSGARPTRNLQPAGLVLAARTLDPARALVREAIRAYVVP